MNKLTKAAIVMLVLGVSACDVVNEKIDVADDAANRMVGKLDNSKLNQTINNSLNSVGDKATEQLPEAIRPPAERLRTDDSPVLGINPDPEIATPINDLADNADSTSSTSQDSVVPEVAASESLATGTTVAELPGSSGSGQLAPGAASPPAVIAADNAPEANREDATSTLGFDIVELTAAGVTLKRVNIRLGPGTEHEVLDTIEAGTPLRVAGRTSSDWLLIEREGQAFGFILGSLIRTDE